MISNVIRPELGTFVKKVAMKWKPPQPSECQRRSTTILAYTWHILTYSQIPVMVPLCSSRYLYSILALRARQPPSPKETPSLPAHDAELRLLLWTPCSHKDACEMLLLVDRECGVNTTHGALGMWPGGTWKYFTVEKICQEKGIPWFMIDPRIYFYCKWDCELNLR